jgi:hypothetical protein
MTLHIRTITPNHVIYVSDRMVHTPTGYIELANDRYKHLILICNNARVVTSFAGIAGVIVPSRKAASELKYGTIDWITEVFQETSKKHHRIEQHLNDLRDQVQDHIDCLRNQYNLRPDSVKLAIQISGWILDIQFDCVIDNYLDTFWRAGPTRSSFTTRHKTYEDEKFEDGSKISIIGKEYLEGKLDHLCEQLLKVARHEDPKGIFETSVEIIRAAAPDSNGCVGYNCSGVRISRNDPGIQVFDDRDESVWDTVMPNTVLSTSRISASTRNMRGRKF